MGLSGLKVGVRRTQSGDLHDAGRAGSRCPRTSSVSCPTTGGRVRCVSAPSGTGPCGGMSRVHALANALTALPGLPETWSRDRPTTPPPRAVTSPRPWGRRRAGVGGRDDARPSPAAAVVVAMGALALVVVLVTPVWRVARHVVTIAHEASHAIAALLTGRRLAGIRLHSDTSGLTVSSGRPRGFGMVLTAFMGYVGPGLIGLGAAALLRQGTPSGCCGCSSCCSPSCCCRSATGSGSGPCSSPAPRSSACRGGRRRPCRAPSRTP